MDKIKEEVWEQGWTYATYRERIDALLAQDKTTGENHSEDFLHYTRMNVARMNRLDKRTSLIHAQGELHIDPRIAKVLVLTEAWCGDAAQVIPVAQQMLDRAGVEVRYILRDEHLDIMDAFLTDGGRSIPKFIFLDAQNHVLGSWGPRPQAVQAMVMERKHAPVQEPYSEFSKKVQLWYAKDKTVSIQQEFGESLSLRVEA